MTTSDMTRADYARLMLGIQPAELQIWEEPTIDQHRPDPNPENATGKAGECWTNAQTHCRQDPDRYGYVEGIVRRGPDAAWEPHGYVLDHQAGHVVEVTTGYAGSVEYLGVELDLDSVDRWFAANPEEQDGPWRSGTIWLMIWSCLENGEALDLFDVIPWPGISPHKTDCGTNGLQTS